MSKDIGLENFTWNYFISIHTKSIFYSKKIVYIMRIRHFKKGYWKNEDFEVARTKKWGEYSSD